jgi:hypothetical protein
VIEHEFFDTSADMEIFFRKRKYEVAPDIFTRGTLLKDIGNGNAGIASLDFRVEI